jgi:hypothetical protein
MVDRFVDADTARAVARAVRASAAAMFDAVLTVARAAEDSARAHRETLEHLRAGFAALDDVFVQVTAPLTLND